MDTSGKSRRSWSTEVKRKITKESFEGTSSVAQLGQKYAVYRPAAIPTPPAVWFCYSADRKGEHPRQHLSSFTGTLQADGYAGFDQIYEAGRIEEATC